MKNICLIPARGGSKRIPKKNIKNFNGKPLISWSIEIARSSGLFDEIYVSTDDNVIANVAIKYGAIVPFLRPENLSNDYARDSQVRKHFIDWMNSNGLKAESLCYLYATAPFICKETLIGCRKLLFDSGASCALTVTTFAYPVLRALVSDNRGFLNYKWNQFSNSRSQDLPEFLHDAAQCYFFNLKQYDEEGERVGYRIPRLYANDIDTPEDFEVAEKLFQILDLGKKAK